MSVKHELQNIISGNGPVRYGEAIQAIASYLKRKKGAGSTAEKTEFSKKQEAQILIGYIQENSLWYEAPEESKYIAEGAEQKIYESSEPEYILKFNDAIFYAHWEDYFHSLLIHNYFFPRLAYALIGFYEGDGTLYAVLKQPFVVTTELTDLTNVREFLLANGFVNKKNNDYYHPQLGIILEDLHDENVLTIDGVLQFVDTVFFLTPEFYKE